MAARSRAWAAALTLTVLAVGALKPAAALQPAEEAAVLLTLPELWTNWDEALASPACQASPGADWSSASMPCGSGGAQAWRGVTCDADGHVSGIAFPFCGLRGPLPPELAKLDALKSLDVQWNNLTGSIPREWTAVGGMPALETLQLARNNLSDALAAFTFVSGGFIANGYFNISHNSLNQGTIPADWYSKKLALLDLSYNLIASTLPAEWGFPKEGHEAEYPSAFPELARLAIEGNNITGPFDPWPGGGATVFSPKFLCTGRPGNPGLLKTPPPPALGSDGGLSAGAIAGIVIGSVVGAALLAGAVWWGCLRRRGARAAAPAGSVGKAGAASSKLGPDSSLAASCDLEKGRVSGEHSAYGSGSGSLEADTDMRRLPADAWSKVEFKDLQLRTQLGRGSYGQVFAGTYCATTVAVKVLGDGVGSSGKLPAATDSVAQRGVARQLQKEAAMLSRLRHQNVVLYMAVCEEPPALVMEHCARGGLNELLAAAATDAKAARHLRWPRLLSMALDAARGMAYLHSRSVFHRDLKSPNLLVTSTWTTKVADVGLAHCLAGGSEQMSTVGLQNPRWLSPELLAGQAAGLPADVWSFGTILWELMTWENPFGNINPYQIISLVQAAESGSGLEVPPAEGLRAGPLGQYSEYTALMADCWQRDPAKRPTFEDVAARLRAILGAEVRSSSSGNLATGASSGAITGVTSPAALSNRAALSIDTPTAGATAAGTQAFSGSAGTTTTTSAQAASSGGGSGTGTAYAGDAGMLASPFAAAPPGTGSAFQ